MKLQLLLLFALIFSINQSTAQCLCPDIQVSNETITVTNIQELEVALDQVFSNNGNMTIVLQPAEYILTSNLRGISENMENLTIMGATQNKEDVIIKGLGWDNNAVTHIFNVAADNFTVANMTIGEVFYHPIQVQSNPADADNFTAQNVKFVDAKEQLLKVSAGGDLYADNGIIQCCEFEFTNGIAYQYYTGGIDAHRANNWLVKNNVFRNIVSPEYNLSEHAIHFWRECSGTTVDGNLIINCDRGIGFGLGEGFENGHTGGIIMNNMVHTTRDVGIGLESSTDTKIYNNTVITENYPRSIEYRFAGTTDALIANNLVNGEISDRSSGSTGVLTANYEFASTDIFEDASNFNFHLAAMPAWLVDQGTALPEVTNDYDCQERPLIGSNDIGADQVKITSSLLDRHKDFIVSVTPNPSSGVIHISGDIKNATIEVYDWLGLKHYNVVSESKEHDIDITGYPSGTYHVKVIGERGGKVMIARVVLVD